MKYDINKINPALDLLKKGGKAQKRGLEILDEYFAEEVVNIIEPNLINSPFSYWDISIHRSSEQLKRIRNSHEVKILHYNENTKTATCKGSCSEYSTSAVSCNCPDFTMRELPCKHMYKVASKYFGVDFYKALTDETPTQPSHSAQPIEDGCSDSSNELKATIALSGKPDNYFDILFMLNKHFKIVSSVSNKIDYLISLDGLENKKTEKANSLNIAIISLEELLKKYNISDVG